MFGNPGVTLELTEAATATFETTCCTGMNIVEVVGLEDIGMEVYICGLVWTT